MKLLFVAMRIHGQHAFIVMWAKAFAARGYNVHLVLLEHRPELAGAVLGEDEADFPFTVHSLGKEHGLSKLRQVARFLRVIREVDHDRVFVHGQPIWGMFGSWYWVLKRVPTYLWYTHYTMHPSLWVTCRYAKRLFCATPQSLPQYDGSPKKVVTGHGIDLGYWPQRPNTTRDPHRLLCVHRLSRSKRVELLIQALALLPPRYTLEIYGDEPDGGAYAGELRSLVSELGLDERISFLGSAPARDLPGIYANHSLILNMATETIDKTMLEAMTCGCFPLVTQRNAEAIGISDAPSDDPGSIADFVKEHAAAPPVDGDSMYRVVAENHSLDGLVAKLDEYIRPGN